MRERKRDLLVTFLALPFCSLLHTSFARKATGGLPENYIAGNQSRPTTNGNEIKDKERDPRGSQGTGVKQEGGGHETRGTVHLPRVWVPHVGVLALSDGVSAGMCASCRGNAISASFAAAAVATERLRGCKVHKVASKIALLALCRAGRRQPMTCAVALGPSHVITVKSELLGVPLFRTGF